ncbi:hypothetical protein FOBRF1_000315 [Fusarium oxysporum]
MVFENTTHYSLKYRHQHAIVVVDPLFRNTQALLLDSALQHVLTSLLASTTSINAQSWLVLCSTHLNPTALFGFDTIHPSLLILRVSASSPSGHTLTHNQSYP